MTRRPRADVLLDRDGVIVRNRDAYVLSWADVEIIDGALEAIARLTHAGHRVFVVTNQSAVGRGLLLPTELERLHARLADRARAAGGDITAFLVCPHLPEDGCACRKPRPGLLLEAARRFGCDLATAVVVGDQLGDILAADAAGCQAVHVRSGVTRSLPAGAPPHRSAADLAEAADLIVGAVATTGAAHTRGHDL